MSINNTRFTPKRRGPYLGDGAGGTSERKAARERDPVLREVGWRTEDIRLTPDGTDVTAAGKSSWIYDFGPVDQMSVGRYLITRQGAASPTAEPLGAMAWAIFDIVEASAGVFTAVTPTEAEGGNASDDAADTQASPSAAMIAVADATLDGSGSDSRATITVVTSADVTDASNWTTPTVLNQGHLILIDAVAAATHVFTVTRLS